MKAIRILALRRLRRQPLRAVIAAISVAAGVSLAVSLLIVVDSITSSVKEHGRALAGPAPLRIIGATSRGGIDQRVLEKVVGVDGVEGAVPLVQAVTIAEDSGNRETIVLAFGVDCRVEAIVGSFGCTDEALAAASADGAPVFVSDALAADLGPGAALRTDVGRVSLDNAVRLPGLDSLNDGRAIVLPLARAQAVFARPGLLDVIYVQPQPNADVEQVKERLQTAVGPVNGVLERDDPPPLVGILLISFVPLFSLISFLGLAIGAVLVFNTVALSVEERRRQLAIVGALGGTSRTTVGGTIVEAAVLGLAGGILGAFGGIVVAGPVTASLSTFTERVAGISLTVHTTPGTFVIAALIGLLVGAFAALRPARRARRIDIAAELSNRDLRDETSPKSTVRRALLLSGITVIAIDGCVIAQHNGAMQQWQATLAPVAFCVAVGSCTLLVAALAPLIVRLLGRRLSRTGATAQLAVANLQRDPGRTGVMAVALGMAVGVAFITASYTAATRHAITESLTDNLKGVAVSTLEANNTYNIDAKMAPATVDALRALPSVERLDRGINVAVGHETGDLLSVGAYENPFLRAELYDGSKDRARFEAGEVLIGAGLARRENLRAGDTLPLKTPTGVVDLEVLGVHANGDFGGHNVQMTYALLERLYGPQPVDGVNVVPKPGVSDEQLKAEILGANLDPDLRAQTAAELAADISDGVAEQLASFWALQRALLATAFVAVLTTLLLVGVQRRRELGLLAAVGMQPRELARMVLTEATVIGVAGAIAGVLVAIPMFGAMLLIAPVLIGFSEPFIIDPMSAIVYGFVAVLVAVLGAAWPAWRTSRIEVLSALQYE